MSESCGNAGLRPPIRPVSGNPDLGQAERPETVKLAERILEGSYRPRPADARLDALCLARGIRALAARLAQAERVVEAAQAAEVQASKAHDAIYREPVDREAANDAIWAIHNALRPALAAFDAADG